MPLTIELDVTDLAGCEAAVEQTLCEHGKLDVVWANAGIGALGPAQFTDAVAWRRTIEVNVIGSYYTVRAALPAVIARRGYVAVTASVASFGHAPQMSAYAASKAAVEAICNSVRAEVAHHGVQVASIHPSWIDTAMVREGDEHPAFALLRASMRPPFKRTYPVDRAANDIVAGFEQRRRRICTPRFVYVAHALRPLLTTRMFERDLLKVAPEMERIFQDEVSEHGTAGASMSDRLAAQLEHRIR